jgi:molybdopterin-guanine dinucleotide biosynthesis protein A
MSGAENPGAVAAVLAGGLGSRLGAPKASVELAGEPLLSRPVAACRRAGLPTVVVTKADVALPPLQVEAWIEPPLPRHPLCGIVAALRRVDGPLVVCAGDMPFLEPALLRWLAGLKEPLAVCRVSGLLHPLLGVYSPGLLPDLERGLASEAPLRRCVAKLGAREVDEAELERFGDPRRILFNVNTALDHRDAERMLAAA